MVLHLAPGDPAEIMLGSQATREDLARLRADLGLNEPLHVQYLTWIGHVARGDLGRSLWMKRPVLGEVLTRLQATLLLTATALVLSSAVGVALGVAAATRPNSVLDRLSAVASLFGASMPSFWLGIVLMVVFALWLGWLPARGRCAHRDGLRVAGRGNADGAGDPRAGLSAGAGLRAGGGALLRPREPRGRSALRLARPAHPL